MTASLLSLCFVAGLVMGKESRRKLRVTHLVFPLVALLLFVGLFVGEGVRRSDIRKELDRMELQGGDRDGIEERLKVLEQRNREIDRILGRDKELEERMTALENTIQ